MNKKNNFSETQQVITPLTSLWCFCCWLLHINSVSFTMHKLLSNLTFLSTFWLSLLPILRNFLIYVRTFRFYIEQDFVIGAVRNKSKTVKESISAKMTLMHSWTYVFTCICNSPRVEVCWSAAQSVFTCSKSTTEIPKTCVKSVQS